MFEKILTNRKIKRLIISLIIGICALGIAESYSQKVMADITGSVVRLHILANSDSKGDQELKIKVRNDIINYMEPMLANAKNIEETKNIITDNLKNLEQVADKSIKKNGYAYSVTALFGNFNFPEKQYENVCFPSGNYDALRIVIGNGDGHNWWCVLYPQLCFSQSADGKMSKENQAKLKNVLSDDEYDMLSSEKVTFKLKVAEWFFN